jgi:hypothetical protein
MRRSQFKAIQHVEIQSYNAEKSIQGNSTRGKSTQIIKVKSIQGNSTREKSTQIIKHKSIQGNSTRGKSTQIIKVKSRQ